MIFSSILFYKLKGELRFSLLFFILILVLGCSNNRQEESFLSSHEGRIKSGILVRAATIKSINANQDACTIEFERYSDNESYCDFVKRADSLFEDLVVVYHIGSQERIGNHNSNTEGLFVGSEVSTDLQLLEKNYEDLLNELPKSFADVSFDDDSVHFELIRGTLSISELVKSDSLEYTTKIIKELREVAMKWRNIRRQEVESIRPRVYDCDDDFSGSIKVSVKYSYLDELCSETNLSYCSCISDAQQLLSRWPQDQMLAQEGCFGSSLRYQFNADESLSDVYNVLVKDVANKAKVNFRPQSKLNVEGGNMLSSDGFLFVGRDILEDNYLDGTNPSQMANLRKIGINSITLASETLVTQKFKEITGDTVIWVGLKDKIVDWRDGIDSSFQPLWHIDMFLALLVLDKSNQEFEDESAVLTYMVAVPDSQSIYWPNPQSLSDSIRSIIYQRNERLAYAIKKTTRLFNGNLKKAGVDSKPIIIPFPIAWNTNGYISSYYAFANGLTEQHCNGDVHYYFPVHEELDSFLLSQVDRAIDSIEMIPSVNVTKVLGPFGKEDALHCQLLVTNRE